MLRHGRNAAIYINGVDISGDANTIEPTSEQELAEVTTFGSAGHCSFPGLAKDSANIEILYNSTSQDVLESLRQAETGMACMIAFGSTLGAPAYATNEVMLKTHNITSVVTDVNRASISIDVDEYPFQPGRMLTAGIQTVALASTGTGTSVDFGSDSGTTGGVAYLQVFSATTSFTCKVLTSSTDAWAGEQATTSFAAVDTATTQRLAFTSSIYRYVKSSWAATSTATFALCLIRY